MSLVLLAVLGACQPATEVPERTAPTRLLVPAIRLDGARFDTVETAALSRGQHTVIEGVSRPTLTSTRAVEFEPECMIVEASGLVECSLALPQDLPRTPWSILEHREPGLQEPQSVATRPAKERDGGEEPRLTKLLDNISGPPRAPKAQLPKDASRFFVAHPIVELTWRAIVTPSITLPGGGILRTWIGTEEPSWYINSAPVVFRIAKYRQSEAEPQILFRRILDPARNAADRGWFPVEIPLPDEGDAPFRLVFETPPRDKEDRRPALPVWGDPTILRPEVAKRRPRTVVLMSLDNLGAQSMSAYGYEIETTPEFAKLLSEGTLFENAFATFPNTIGSHMSMATGLYPANHRVRKSGSQLDPKVRNLAQRMRDAGYETAAFAESSSLSEIASFRRGFARYRGTGGAIRGEGKRAGNLQRAIQWMEEQPDEPRFLFLQIDEFQRSGARRTDAHDLLSETALSLPEKARAHEQEIRHLDGLLAKFLAQLENLVDPGELLVIITAGHGRALFADGETSLPQFHDEVMHVPLYFRWPGEIPAGLKIDTPVSLVDIVPTVEELLGIAPLEADGLSLVPLMEGHSLARSVVFGQTVGEPLIGGGIRWVARSKSGKCMVEDRGAWARCFNLTLDPRERTPLRPNASPSLEALHRETLAHREAIQSTRAREESQKTLLAAMWIRIESGRQEQLRALGLIE